MKKLHIPVALAIVATGCSSLSPSEDPVALKMTDLEARLLRIERIVENQSLVELSSGLEALRSETAMLRGEIETLRFESENSDSRQRELYVDVDRRLQQLETTPRAVNLSDRRARRADSGATPRHRSLFAPAVPRRSSRS